MRVRAPQEPDHVRPDRDLTQGDIPQSSVNKIALFSMTDESTEQLALVQCYDDLIQLIQHSVVPVSSKLYSKGLVAKDVHDSVLSVDGASNHSKAAKLLSCAIDKVKESADRFQDFIDVLGEDRYFDGIVLKIYTNVQSKHNIEKGIL